MVSTMSVEFAHQIKKENYSPPSILRNFEYISKQNIAFQVSAFISESTNCSPMITKGPFDFFKTLVQVGVMKYLLFTRGRTK